MEGACVVCEAQDETRLAMISYLFSLGDGYIGIHCIVTQLLYMKFSTIKINEKNISVCGKNFGSIGYVNYLTCDDGVIGKFF